MYRMVYDEEKDSDKMMKTTMVVMMTLMSMMSVMLVMTLVFMVMAIMMEEVLWAKTQALIR
jgi:uncharacterized protein YqhQ